MNLFDASALLVFLLDEPGADAVEEQLVVGGAVSAANWAEVAQKVRAADGNWALARALLHSFMVVVEPVTVLDASAPPSSGSVAPGPPWLTASAQLPVNLSTRRCALPIVSGVSARGCARCPERVRLTAALPRGPEGRMGTDPGHPTRVRCSSSAPGTATRAIR